MPVFGIAANVANFSAQRIDLASDAIGDVTFEILAQADEGLGNIDRRIASRAQGGGQGLARGVGFGGTSAERWTFGMRRLVVPHLAAFAACLQRALALADFRKRICFGALGAQRAF